MTTQGVFDSFTLTASRANTSRSTSHHRKLWSDTWNRIDLFLPNFLSELFPNEKVPSGTDTPEEGVVDVLIPEKEGPCVKEGHTPSEVGGRSSSPVLVGSQSPGGSSGHTPQSSPPRGSPGMFHIMHDLSPVLMGSQVQGWSSGHTP